MALEGRQSQGGLFGRFCSRVGRVSDTVLEIYKGGGSWVEGGKGMI